MSFIAVIRDFLWSVLVRIDVFIDRVLGPIWRPLRYLWSIIKPSRFSAFTLLAGGALLVATPQGRELAMRFDDDDVSTVQAMAVFLACVGWFAFQAWYWARIAFYFEQGYGHRQGDKGRKWAPRFYAGAAFGFAAWSLYIAGRGGLENATTLALITVAVGLAFVVFLVIRVPLAERLGLGGSLKSDPGDGQPTTFADLSPVSKAWLTGSILFSLVMLGLIIWNPVGIGQWFGAASIAFLAFGHIVPVGSALIIRSRETGAPIIVSFLVFAGAISAWSDNHAVAVAKDDGAPGFEDRLSVDDAVDAWLAVNGGTGPTGAPGAGDTARPVIFVATAGGGLRAAYWTAVVMGELQKTCPGVERHVFSISGVSGGSVGAAVYATALHNGMAPPVSELCGAADASAGDIRGQILGTLSDEFLGPTVAAMFYPDLVQRFIPWGFLPDRGGALADAWNVAWHKACGSGASCSASDLDAPFLKVAGTPGAGGGWQPILLLNGTHQETGKRLIASNIKVTSDVFLDAFDLHAMVQHDVSMGMAALNSARFTYVSPAGRLVRAGDGEGMGHVLDGGYFENYGAVTSAEIARAAVKAFEKRGVAIRPILIQISSDPDLPARDQPGGAAADIEFLGYRADLASEKPGGIANEVLGPLWGILNTRTARGVLANKTIADVVDSLKSEPHRFPAAMDPVFVHFSMCAWTDGRKPPLGWAMSQRTRKDLEEMIGGRCGENDNAASMAAVVEALKTPLPVGCVPDTPSGALFCRSP
ncbi:hypothetical protein QKW60_16560 [Defluviimonas aestuarii]|uniref:hypothetical protein n=1 Tax=Albidovulum aestuarii TaxID=1130726 RepID=UPI00249AB1D8|nr:hypothetical protein [Defluviimonas aestuarii]MDI3338022.1 hypothetical protein [Defluviimonas aestuarii]